MPRWRCNVAIQNANNAIRKFNSNGAVRYYLYANIQKENTFSPITFGHEENKQKREIGYSLRGKEYTS
jgi:hypothetical protein